jgi:hypothetical protein
MNTSTPISAYAKFKVPPCVNIKHFKMFIGTLPPRRHYDYGNPSGCPLALFLKASGEPAYARDGLALPEPLRAALNPRSHTIKEAYRNATYGNLWKRLQAIT